VRFYFPDSQDQIDPHFNLVTEEHPVHRIRQRDDVYAHEALKVRPFDGLLLSKALVDGQGMGAAGHYSNAARTRLYREGVRRFFRLPDASPPVATLGDCGAFAYVNEAEVPYTVNEVIDFYEHCQFDAGIAPDHIVFGFARDDSKASPELVAEGERRRRITIENAERFLHRHQQRKCRFEPLAVAHGWSAASYADSVDQLQRFGYQRIAMGGMVPLRTIDIVSSLEAIARVLTRGTELHLLGVTRTDEIPTFASLGVTSFDSTSPFRQAFKDDLDNFYTLDGTFVAVRVPQVDGNAALKRQIAAGRVNQRKAIIAERATLDILRRYDRGGAELEAAVRAVMDYDQLVQGKGTYESEYRRTLEARAWTTCDCGLCESAGIDIVLFRGSERNKRRGFHNLAVFRNRLHRTLGTSPSQPKGSS